MLSFDYRMGPQTRILESPVTRARGRLRTAPFDHGLGRPRRGATGACHFRRTPPPADSDGLDAPRKHVPRNILGGCKDYDQAKCSFKAVSSGSQCISLGGYASASTRTLMAGATAAAWCCMMRKARLCRIELRENKVANSALSIFLSNVNT